MPPAIPTKIEKAVESKTEIDELQEDLNDVSAYLSDFLAFLPLSICDVSPTGMISNVNRAFEQFSGFTLTEAVGQYLADFFSETKLIDKLLIKTPLEGTVKKQELTLITKNGKKIPVSLSIAAKKDSQGNLTGFFLSLTDISGFKEIQEQVEQRISERTKDLEESRRAVLNILEDTKAAKVQVEEERAKTQVIFNNFIDGLLIFSPDKELELMNTKAEEYLEISQKNLIGKSMDKLVEVPEMTSLIKIIKKKAGKVFREEMGFKDKELVLEITTQPIEYGKKAVNLVILHDISREKVIERLKTQFVSVAAHQLRTPLSILKWSLSMLIEGEIGSLSLEQKEMLEKANQTNERMIRLINDLLNVARIEEGRFIYQPKAIDLSELIHAIVEPAEPVAKEKKVNLQLKISEGKGSMIVKADVEKLSLAIKNLVDNAIRYSDAGGKVIVSLQRKGSNVEVSVKDSGIGIPKDQHQRVFKKFFRGDNAVRKQTEGTGLGLFIVKNIIEAHNGTVWFESAEGKGTTFSFALPAIG